MKLIPSMFLFAVCLCSLVVGCSSDEPRRATDGADADAIRQYEEAVAAMEQQDIDSNMEAEATSGR